MTGSDLTVVIPTYKRPRLLARALESVLRQRVPEARVAVFDNASGDETENVVRSLSRQHPIGYVRHERNLGVTGNFRSAIGAVETRYCCILNDDDMHLRGLIESALDAFSRHPTAGAFCARTLAYRPSAKMAAWVQGTTWAPGFYRAATATAQMIREHLTPTAVVFATEALRDVDFSFGDIEMMARLADRHSFVVSDRILGVYTLHGDAWSSARTFEDGQHALLTRLADLLRLENLSDDERLDVTLMIVRQLMESTLGHAMRRDESKRPPSRAVRRAAAILNALEAHASRPGESLSRAAVARFAPRSDAPLSARASVGLRAIARLGRGFDTLLERSPRAGESYVDVLSQIDEMERAADALLATLPRRTQA
jgi:hypothetical protein